MTIVMGIPVVQTSTYPIQVNGFFATGFCAGQSFTLLKGWDFSLASGTSRACEKKTYIVSRGHRNIDKHVAYSRTTS